MFEDKNSDTVQKKASRNATEQVKRARSILSQRHAGQSRHAVLPGRTDDANRHIQTKEKKSLIVVFILLILLLLVLVLLPLLAQSFANPLVTSILRLVPLHIILLSHKLDLAPKTVALFDQSLPQLQVKSLLLVKLALAARDGEVHCTAVGHFAVVVEEPGVTADQCRETDEVGNGFHDVPAEFGLEGEVPVEIFVSSLSFNIASGVLRILPYANPP